jgi:NDP-sugar pyrophosphorylase family protein
MSEGIYTMTALYLQLASLHKISTFRVDSGYWFNVGTPEILEEVKQFIAHLKPQTTSLKP